MSKKKMTGKIFGLLLTVNVLLLGRAQQGDEDDRNDTGGLQEFLASDPELSEFARMLTIDGLHRAFLSRQVTVFAPINVAIQEFDQRASESLLLNHMTNFAIKTDVFPERLSSLLTGNPPLWITNRRDGIYVNHAKILRSNIRRRTRSGDEQIIHVIDSVLDPLVPIAIRDSEVYAKLDAYKLMSQSTLYDLGGAKTRIFAGQALKSKKAHMFGVPGQHTFFLPVDTAFDTSVQLSGYAYHEESRLRDEWSGKRLQYPQNSLKKEQIDARVIEGHIVPHRLLFTSHAPTPEYPTVAWFEKGVQVNVSLQPTSFQYSYDPRLAGNPSLFDEDRNYDRVLHRLTSADYERINGTEGLGGFRYPGYQNQREEFRDENDFSQIPKRQQRVVVRSNTIVGDLIHPRGMVVARMVKANIPVANGVVHLIDKPLMVVAKTLYEYVMEEGSKPGNRLTQFAKLLRDKGGAFTETLLEAKQGTLLAPSDLAFEQVNQEEFNYRLGSVFLRAEMLGLHFVRERIASTDYEIRATGEDTFSTPAALATNRVWFHFNPDNQVMTVEGRGVNATVTEKDIGTVNGIIHVVDRILGVPHKTVWQKLQDDPNLSHMASLVRQFRLDEAFDSQVHRRFFTLVAPTNEAWEQAQMHFTKAYNTLVEGTNEFPNYGRGILERHFKVEDRPLNFQELVEMTRNSPRRTVEMRGSQLTFTLQGEGFKDLDAYKDHYVSWGEVKGKVIRPNQECINGIIHVVDTVFIDDSPPWTVGTANDLGTSLTLTTLLFAVNSFLL